MEEMHFGLETAGDDAPSSLEILCTSCAEVLFFLSGDELFIGLYASFRFPLPLKMILFCFFSGDGLSRTMPCLFPIDNCRLVATRAAKHT